MRNYIQLFKRLVRCEHGLTKIEYGLLGALIAVVILFAVRDTGRNVQAVFCETALAVSGEGCPIDGGEIMPIEPLP
jgi:pilus assembly protein Flp/PilA